jgi:hypothetical protein
VAKLRERISVSKQASQKFDLERCDLRKLDDIQVKEKYQVEISNRYAALESLDGTADINSAWESIRENISSSSSSNQCSGTWRNSIYCLASQYNFAIGGVFSVFKTVHFRR